MLLSLCQSSGSNILKICLFACNMHTPLFLKAVFILSKTSNVINYLVNIRTISTLYEVSFDLCPVIVAFPSHIVINVLDMIIPFSI